MHSNMGLLEDALLWGYDLCRMLRNSMFRISVLESLQNICRVCSNASIAWIKLALVNLAGPVWDSQLRNTSSSLTEAQYAPRASLTMALHFFSRYQMTGLPILRNFLQSLPRTKSNVSPAS